MLKKGPFAGAIDGNVIMSYKTGIFNGEMKNDNHAIIGKILIKLKIII